MNPFPPIRYSHVFIKALAKLPKAVQTQTETAILLFQSNPDHPSLHTKKLSGELAGRYSFRVGREYRVIFQLASKRSVELMLIGNRKDIYRKKRK